MTTTEPITVERQHHPYSASTLQAREACCHYKPRQETTVAALAGTAQHDSVESGASHELLTDSQAAAVEDCILFFQSLVAKNPGCHVYREAYLPVDGEPVVSPTSAAVWTGTTAGYADAALITKDLKAGVIVDWKFGMWEVEDAGNNLQGIAYALGLFHLCSSLETVTVYFIQPHLDSLDEHTFFRAEVPKLLLRIRTVVARAQNPVDPPRPNEMSCLFCAKLCSCRPVCEFALDISRKYRPLQVPENVTPEMIQDPAQAGAALKLAAVMAAWSKRVKDWMNERTLECESFVPAGYMRVSVVRRVVKQVQRVIALAKRFIDPEKVDALVEISLTPLEAEISAKAPRGQKESTVAEFQKMLLESGAVELGQPFAYLRVVKTNPKSKTQHESEIQ